MQVRKFRKKPVVVEAIRYIPGKTCGVLAEWMGVPHDECTCTDDAPWGIVTLEGAMIASPGDWIIKGVQGEFYSCKPEIFIETYEAVDDEPEPDDSKRYKIVRYVAQGENQTLLHDLSLEEARDHCRRGDTHGEGWFDGYAEDDGR